MRKHQIKRGLFKGGGGGGTTNKAKKIITKNIKKKLSNTRRARIDAIDKINEIDKQNRLAKQHIQEQKRQALLEYHSAVDKIQAKMDAVKAAYQAEISAIKEKGGQ